MARVRPPTGNLPFRTANQQVTITDLESPPLGPNMLDREAIASAVREGSMTIAEGQALLAELEAPATINASDNIDVGAAGDPNAIINANYGALTPSTLQQYLDLGKNLYPTSKDIDPRLLALQFFTNMAAESSKPGATAIGAAGTAGSGVVNTLLEERKQKRAEELGAAQLGVSLASTLGKPQTLKVGATRGEQARYMTDGEAREYFQNKGLSPNSPNFERLVGVVTAPTPSMVGKPVVYEDTFLELIPMVKGNEIVDYNVTPVTTGAKPRSAVWFEQRVKELKDTDAIIGASFETIEKVQQALDTLMAGQETGIWESATASIKQVFAEVMGNDMPAEIVGLQDLEAISNYLAPKMRPKGSGSTSDMEFEAYRKAILAIKKTPLGNYVSLYTFMKSQQNSSEAVALERQLLTRGATSEDVDLAIKEIDKGLYEKYYGDLDNEAEFNAWYDALPRGALVLNSHPETGEPLFLGKWKEDGKTREKPPVWHVKGAPPTFY
jgi:hypothetical protein